MMTEIMEIIERVEEVVDRYEARDEIAFTFGLAAPHDAEEPSWHVLCKFLVQDEEELAEILGAMLRSFAINAPKRFDEDNIDDIDLEDLGFSLN